MADQETNTTAAPEQNTEPAPPQTEEAGNNEGGGTAMDEDETPPAEEDTASSVQPLTLAELAKAKENGLEIGVVDDRDPKLIRRGTINMFNGKQDKAHIYYTVHVPGGEKFTWVFLNSGRIVDAKHVSERSEEEISAAAGANLHVQIPSRGGGADEHGYNSWNRRPYDEFNVRTDGMSNMELDPDAGFDPADLEAAIKASMADAGGQGVSAAGGFGDQREAAPSPRGARNPNGKKGRRQGMSLNVRWGDQQQGQAEIPTSFASRDLSKIEFDLVLTEEPKPAAAPPAVCEKYVPKTDQPSSSAAQDTEMPAEEDALFEEKNNPPPTTPDPVASAPYEEDLHADIDAIRVSPVNSDASGAGGFHDVRAPSPRDVLRATQGRQAAFQQPPDYLTGSAMASGTTGAGGYNRRPERQVDASEFLARCREKTVLTLEDHRLADIYLP